MMVGSRVLAALQLILVSVEADPFGEGWCPQGFFRHGESCYIFADGPSTKTAGMLPNPVLYTRHASQCFFRVSLS